LLAVGSGGRDGDGGRAGCLDDAQLVLFGLDRGALAALGTFDTFSTLARLARRTRRAFRTLGALGAFRTFATLGAIGTYRRCGLRFRYLFARLALFTRRTRRARLAGRLG